MEDIRQILREKLSAALAEDTPPLADFIGGDWYQLQESELDFFGLHLIELPGLVAGYTLYEQALTIISPDLDGSHLTRAEESAARVAFDLEAGRDELPGWLRFAEAIEIPAFPALQYWLARQRRIERGAALTPCRPADVARAEAEAEAATARRIAAEAQHRAIVPMLDDFRRAAVPMRVQIAPEMAAFLDRWEVWQDKSQTKPLNLTDKLHLLLIEKRDELDRLAREAAAPIPYPAGLDDSLPF